MLRLYWARNDGLGGHVFLGLADLERLAAEMNEQGMTGWLALDRLEPGATIPAGAIDFALSQASLRAEDARRPEALAGLARLPRRRRRERRHRRQIDRRAGKIAAGSARANLERDAEANPDRGGRQMSQAPQEPPAGPPSQPSPPTGRRRPQPLGGRRSRRRSRRARDRPLRRASPGRRGRLAGHDRRRADHDARDDAPRRRRPRSRPPRRRRPRRPRPRPRPGRLRRSASSSSSGTDSPSAGSSTPRSSRASRSIFIVRSDVSDHVHLHGYDLLADVAPGQPARIRFRATTVGVFEAELEDRVVLIAELEVRP